MTLAVIIVITICVCGWLVLSILKAIEKILRNIHNNEDRNALDYSREVIEAGIALAILILGTRMLL